MRALRSPGAILVLLFSLPTGTAAQVARDAEEESPDCEQVCQAFPNQAPAECVCALTGMSGGASSLSLEDLVEMSAPEILAIERAAYLERMKGIQDYWLIERSNVAPVPTVIPYKRNAPGAWPPFRQVTQPELEQHWIDTDPNMSAEQRATAQAMADDPAGAVQAMGQAIGIFSDALADKLPIGGLAEAGESVEGGFDDAAASIARTTTEDAKAQEGDALAVLEAATKPIWAQAEPTYGVYDPSQPIGARVLGMSEEKMWELTDKNGLAEPCVVLVYDGPPFDVEGVDGVTYTITRAERWLRFANDTFVTIYIRLEIEALTAAGFQRDVMHEEMSGFTVVRGIFLAERIRRSFSDHTVFNSYEVGGVNEGLPTRADFVDTFGETGVPGAGGAWP